MEERKGFILLARKMIDSDIFSKPPLYLKVWIYILSRAYHTESGGIKKGQFKTSIKEIQDACTFYVGYRKEVPTKKQIFSILEYLRNPYEGTTKGTMIATTKVTQGILISVLNYSIYQDFKYYEGNNEKPTKNLRTEQQGNNKEKALKKALKGINKKDLKEYGTFANVLLSDNEYSKLSEKNLLSYIDDLSSYMESTGKTYKGHYATILSWKGRDEKKVNKNEIIQTWEQAEEETLSDEERERLIKSIKGERGK